EINPDTGESAKKQTGSFYTPREIVDYMVDSTIQEYIKSKTNIKDTKLENLINYTVSDSDIDNSLTVEETDAIIDSLYTLTLLDPACGSGAFPIGVLQKVVYILHELDPDAKKWINKVCKNIPYALKSELKAKVDVNALDYIRKLSVLQNSIYGVDIQPIAVEIARLRCFLSLIIHEKIQDSEPNRGILPLPNLDFKFAVVNTLVRLDSGRQIDFFEVQDDMDQLKQIRDEYFGADEKMRNQLKADFKQIQKKMLDSIKTNYLNAPGKRYDQLSKWNPFDNEKTDWFHPAYSLGIDGFDIVIANPPYVHLEDINPNTILAIIGSKTKPEYKTYVGRGDLYCLFYERGFELLNKNGFLTYITSNKWMRAGYGQVLRDFFVKYTNPITLIDLGSQRFKSATVDTNIITLQNTKNAHKTKSVIFNNQSMSSIVQYIKSNNIEMNFEEGDIWTILDSMEQDIIRKIDSTGTPLKDWNIKINYGIKTGCNDAFIIDQPTRDKLIDGHPKSATIIHPVLRGRDIMRYSYQWAGLYIIVMDPSRKYNIDDFPSIKEHLLNFGYDKLKQTGDKGARSKSNYKWFELQISITYIDDLKESVICWQRITHQPTFCATKEGMFILDSMAFLSRLGKNREYLLSILNSKLFAFWVDKSVPQYGENGYRLSNQYVEIFKIPIKTGEDKRLTENEIFKLYKLTDDEINYILKWYTNRYQQT
ncbi:MAG: N-6 DNA methylase, partial [Christensenellaceae bacterium]|nr:N-6 DNA methylase [Christensenellaceae bacterium]